jgi:fucose 4-O-acetylase-like acetyltransferase
MPCFVFISGYLSKNPEKCREKAFESLLVPYVVMSVLWEIYCVLFSVAVHGHPPELFNFSILNPVYGLWYLQALFIWRYFLKDILRIKHVFAISVFLSIFVGMLNEFGTLLSMSRVIVFLPFFLAGYYTHKNNYLLKILTITKFKSFIIVFITAATALSMSLSDDRLYRFLFYHCSFNDAGLMPAVGIITRAMFLFVSTMMIIALLKITPDKSTKLSAVGKNSMLIYVGHFYMVNIFHSIFYSQSEINILLSGFIFIILTIKLLSMDFINNIYKKMINDVINNLFVTDNINNSI